MSLYCCQNSKFVIKPMFWKSYSRGNHALTVCILCVSSYYAPVKYGFTRLLTGEEPASIKL